MDIRSSKLVVSLALVFTLVVSMMAYIAFRNARFPRLGVEQADNNETERRIPARRYVYDKDRAVADREEFQSLLRMRDALDARTRLLHLRSQELAKSSTAQARLASDHELLTAQYERLRQEADQTAALLADLMEQIEIPDQPTFAVSSNAQISDGAAIDAFDPQTIDSEIDTSLMQWQLDQANERIAELEQSVVREILRSTEATRALISTQGAAVVPLLDLLADENAEVRIWAATVLGQIGPEASLAEEALIQALTDRDERVRQAARAALRRIDNES